jgi:hypothetical protein
MAPVGSLEGPSPARPSAACKGGEGGGRLAGMPRKSTSGTAVAADHGANPGLRVAAEEGSANGASGSADRGGVSAAEASSLGNGSKSAAFTRAATGGSCGSEGTLSTDTGALVVPVSSTAEVVA